MSVYKKVSKGLSKTQKQSETPVASSSKLGLNQESSSSSGSESSSSEDDSDDESESESASESESESDDEEIGVMDGESDSSSDDEEENDHKAVKNANGKRPAPKDFDEEDEESDEDDVDESPVSLENCVESPIYPADGSTQTEGVEGVRACILCTGLQLKNAKMVEYHLKSKRHLRAKARMEERLRVPEALVSRDPRDIVAEIEEELAAKKAAEPKPIKKDKDFPKGYKMSPAERIERKKLRKELLLAKRQRRAEKREKEKAAKIAAGYVPKERVKKSKIVPKEQTTIYKLTQALTAAGSEVVKDLKGNRKQRRAVLLEEMRKQTILAADKEAEAKGLPIPSKQPEFIERERQLKEKAVSREERAQINKNKRKVQLSQKMARKRARQEEKAQTKYNNAETVLEMYD